MTVYAYLRFDTVDNSYQRKAQLGMVTEYAAHLAGGALAGRSVCRAIAIGRVYI